MSFRLVGYGMRETPEQAVDRLVRYYGSPFVALENHLHYQASNVAKSWTFGPDEHKEFWGHEEAITKELNSRILDSRVA